MALIDNLREMKRTREAYWRRYPQTSPTKLRWRAITVRHWFHVLPTESVLEIGAGSGLWTEQRARLVRALTDAYDEYLKEISIVDDSRRRSPGSTAATRWGRRASAWRGWRPGYVLSLLGVLRNGARPPRPSPPATSR